MLLTNFYIHYFKFLLICMRQKRVFRPWHIPIFINIPSFETTDDGIPYRSNKTVITRLSALYRCRTAAEYSPEPRF